MASLISPRSLAPSLSFFFFLFSFAQDGGSLYQKHCASCHHESRIGRTAPPLIPQTLKRKDDGYLFKVIREGIPATTMPSFPELSLEDIKKIISYIRSPVESVSYTIGDIERSHQNLDEKPKELGIKNIKNIVVVVDKGGGSVWVMEENKVLDRFPFRNVHGGVKFSDHIFYVPARDGWIISYDLKRGKPVNKVRACVYLRNIALSSDGEHLVASCVLPHALVLMNKNLEPLKMFELPGRPGAVYELNGAGSFILTFRELPKVAIFHPEKGISFYEVEEPIEDFFIDPFERFLVGSSREKGKLVVYELDNFRKVYEREVPGLPHLFSSTFWYSDGDFFFATRHINSTKVSVWKLYDWELVKEIDTGGKGFFVRTSPDIPHLWVDNSDNTFVLIDKRTLRVEKHRIVSDGRATHVEFTPDGRFAYISVVGRKGRLIVYDPVRLVPVKELSAVYPAGKYNFVLKSRRFYPSLLGREVFMARCWGCHHLTQEAFGPPFRWIAERRSKELIVSQIVNPQETSKLLGYRRSAMPKLNLTNEELQAVLALMEELKNEQRLAGSYKQR